MMADEGLGKTQLGGNAADGEGSVQRGQHDPQPRWVAQQSEHVSQVGCLIFCQRRGFDGHFHSFLYMNRYSYGDICSFVKNGSSNRLSVTKRRCVSSCL